MNTYSNDNLKNRKDIATNLANQYIAKNAPSVTFIEAAYGQGKSYIVQCVVNSLKKNKDIKVYRNIDNDFISESGKNTSKVNSISVSGGALGFSFGFGLGWSDNESSYMRVRNLLSKQLKNNILICVENISDSFDEMRLLTSNIIRNITKLENEFKKRIFLLITDTQEVYLDTIYKYTNSYKKIELTMYTKQDVKAYMNLKKTIIKISEDNIEHIWALSQGNLDLVDFIYEEVLINEQDYILVLQDIVAKRIAIIKSQGEKCEINSKQMEEIIFSASLTLKEFSAQFITNVINEKIIDVEKGLDIVSQESMMKRTFSNYYNFVSSDIQNHIAEVALNKHGNLLISFYDYYTHNEQDEYYYRAFYLYKYYGRMSPQAFSLFFLAYASARQIEDGIIIKKIENIIIRTNNDENYKNMYKAICNYYDILFGKSSIEKVKQAYTNIINEYDWELPIKAEITFEYFSYIYMKTDLNNAAYHNILEKCISYALNELIIDVQDPAIIKPTDETLLRLKIIYGISPCILDILNDYNTFNELYQKSKELSLKSNAKHCGIGKYIENVFNRKAFLFSNPAACSIYYDKAKKYFEQTKNWIEYYITLVCQAGTDIVIQEFDEAIELCNQVESDSQEKDIQLPQMEKLYNNKLIAKFLLDEQNSKTPQKAIAAAKKAINNLKKLITNEKCENQFVIYTNICSLYLYTENDEKYKIYKKRLEKIYGCKDISDVLDQSVDDFYRYYFSWFELYLKIKNANWKEALELFERLKNLTPTLFCRQEIFWNEKNEAVKSIILAQKKINAYDFCHNLVKNKRSAQSLSKFFYRGLMLSDLQYTSYI